MGAIRFDNRFVRELPGDAETSLRRRQVRNACWSPATPTPVTAPSVLAHSREVAAMVGFTEADVAAPWFAEVFGGNRLLDGMEPYAACYGGHQFGNWAGQLGDGRAMTLGEVVSDDGQRHELQLKGAGPTAYSRTADGRAVLRSSIREFLCSEAMHHLGVPTTRALSLVATGDTVVRDMFYNGNARPEQGAIVCRVAPSFIRFGNFEILTARNDLVLLERLVDFTMSRDFPHLTLLGANILAQRAAWFAEVCERTARMIVHWMRVGFVHGVMNTDNMSILGLTIDYGPYGWLDNYDPQWTPNTTDASDRRYRYEQQPGIAQWNLVRLAEALVPLFGSEAPLQDGLSRYQSVFLSDVNAMHRAKFGLRDDRDGDDTLMRECFALLQAIDVDYTLFFRALGDLPDILPADAADARMLGDVFYDDDRRIAREGELWAWVRRWHARVMSDNEPMGARRTRMHAVNPKFVLRNYLAQQAIDAAESGDASPVHALLDVMRRPYDEQPQNDAYAARRPEWARDRAGCSMLSCSS